MKKSLTEGSVFGNLLRFSVPYLISCFLQTFYGLADLFITGQFNGASAITAVSVGSQIMHMLTVVIVGLAMGSTVTISRAAGAGDEKRVRKTIGNTVTIFAVFAIISTVLLLIFTGSIMTVLSVPKEAWNETKEYITVCFMGVLFITAYNVISGIFRGMGDSKTPMYFIAFSGVLNIGLDYLFIGGMGMGAKGAAMATVAAQAAGALLSLIYIKTKTTVFTVGKSDFRISKQGFSDILKVGMPIAAQDGLIQIAFLVITVIANRRGVDIAAAVGIVEKLIGFMFLVPSAMLSAVSTIAAQNAGAGLHDRGRITLLYANLVGIASGVIFSVLCNINPEAVISLFARDEAHVITMGAQYLRSYVFDTIAAAVHFCFSGYFCAYRKSYLSFVHNIASIVLIRIPGAYFASVWYPQTLLPMGAAAPIGSVLSALICIGAYILLFKENKLYENEKKEKLRGAD